MASRATSKPLCRRAMERVRAAGRLPLPLLRRSSIAQEDIVQVLAYTEKHFGRPAGRHYEGRLVTALRDIACDPEPVGRVARPDLGSRCAAPIAATAAIAPGHVMAWSASRDTSCCIGLPAYALSSASKTRYVS